MTNDERKCPACGDEWHAGNPCQAVALPKRPVWVVELVQRNGGKSTWKRDTKYVRAATEAGAIRTAKAHSTLPLNCDAAARLATAADLGCVKETQ